MVGYRASSELGMEKALAGADGEAAWTAELARSLTVSGSTGSLIEAEERQFRERPVTARPESDRRFQGGQGQI